MDSRATHYFPILVAGANGSGKSTLINFLASKTMTHKEANGRFVQYQDDSTHTLYFDIPAIDTHCAGSKALKTYISDINEIRNIMEHIKEKKGAIIFVLDYDCLYGPDKSIHQRLLDTLRILNDEMFYHYTLFVITKTKKFISSDGLVEDVEFTLDLHHRFGFSDVSKIIFDPNHWICANVLDENTKKAINKWLEIPRLLSGGENLRLSVEENIKAIKESMSVDETPVGPPLEELTPERSFSSTTSIYLSTAQTTPRELKAIEKEVDTYTEEMQKYIDHVTNYPNHLEVLKDLPSHKLFGCLDSVAKKITRIPVFLDNRLYDLQTLLDLPEKDGFRTTPMGDRDFCLGDIEPAKDVHAKIQEMINVTLQEEQSVRQAETIAASAKRTQKPRGKCVVL